MRTLSAIYLFTFIAVAHAEQYWCIADSAVGFKYNASNKNWEQATLTVEDGEYIISKADPNSARSKRLQGSVEYLVTKVGSMYAHIFCKEGFTANILRCSGVGSELTFNKNNGRFMHVHGVGYVEDEKGDTPRMEIGKCSPL